MPHLEYSIQLQDHEHRKDIDLLKQAQRKNTKLIKWLEHLPYKERLREVGLFGLKKRRLQGNQNAAFQYLKGANERAGEWLQSESRFKSAVRKKFITVRA